MKAKFHSFLSRPSLVTINYVSQKHGLQCTGKVPLHQLERRTNSKDLPSMSRRCMIIASSTSLGMYPRERIAMPSSCLDIKPFPSLSSTRKASRISVKEKEEERSCYGEGVSAQCICTHGTQKQHILPFLILMESIRSFRVSVIMSCSYTQIFLCVCSHPWTHLHREINTTASALALPIFYAKYHCKIISSLCIELCFFLQHLPWTAVGELIYGKASRDAAAQQILASEAFPAVLLQAPQHVCKADLLYVTQADQALTFFNRTT